MPAAKVDEHAPTYANESNGSKAVIYKPYWVTPMFNQNENCSSTVQDALRASAKSQNMMNLANKMAVPWFIHDFLSYNQRYDKGIKNVTKDAQKGAEQNRNGTPKPKKGTVSVGKPRVVKVGN